MTELQTSRRSLFGVLAAGAVVAATPLEASLPSQWEAAKAEFIAARNAEDVYDRAVFTPVWERVGSSRNGELDRTADEIDRLTNIRCDAEERLVQLPAPDLRAVLWKIQYARERWVDFEDWPAAWWDAVIADLNRFAGGLN